MRQSKGCVFRPVVTRVIDGRRRKRRAKFYWIKYIDARGDRQRHVLRLPNLERVTDRAVATELLEITLNRVEREAAGLIDVTVEAAYLSMRTVAGRYLKHLRRRQVSRRHVEQVIGCLKVVIEKSEMKKLADFTSDRVEKALAALTHGNRSPRTINVYRRCMGAMGEWAVKSARILDRNPVAVVARLNEAVDTRKVRRSLSIAEADSLLAVAGPRRLFYSLQLWSGLRVGEARTLRWSDVDLSIDRPCIRLRAESTKSRRADELPLHPALAVMLRSAKPSNAAPGSRVFDSVPILRTVKADLVRCGIARVEESDNGKKKRVVTADEAGRTLDRHALRTTFISWLGFYGVDPRAQIALARHAPTGVTMRHYQDFRVFDLWAEIAKLPGPNDDAIAERATVTLRATGTENGRSGAVVLPVVPTHGISSPKLAGNGRMALRSLAHADEQKLAFSPRKTAFFATGAALGDTGLEPVTSCVSSRRSSQLS